MNPNDYIDIDSAEDVLSHELTQFVVREAVGAAMASPLREAILEGVARDEGGHDGHDPHEHAHDGHPPHEHDHDEHPPHEHDDPEGLGFGEADPSPATEESGGSGRSLATIAALGAIAVVAYATRRRGEH